MTYQKIQKKSVDSEYAKIKRLCIRICTWSSKMSQLIFSTSLLHDILLYTIGFVKMRRIQPYHFHYVNRVGKQPPQQNPVFFPVGTMLMRLWLFNRSVPLKKIKVMYRVMYSDVQSDVQWCTVMYSDVQWCTKWCTMMYLVLVGHSHYESFDSSRLILYQPRT